MRVKTSSDEVTTGRDCERKSVLECDRKAKEIREMCQDYEVIDKIKCKGNVSVKHNFQHCEKKVSEVVKTIDSDMKLKEYLQDKYGDKWTHIDIEARTGFVNSTVNKIKCAAGLNMYGERVKLIDKTNAHVCCLLCKADESWEHVLLCDKF